MSIINGYGAQLRGDGSSRTNRAYFTSTARGVRAQYQLLMAIAFWQARSMGWKQA